MRKFIVAFVCLWAYKDGGGNWYVFDEFVDDTAMYYDQRADAIRDRHPWPPLPPHPRRARLPRRIWGTPILRHRILRPS